MIQVAFYFTVDEALSLFRASGLTVLSKEVEIDFDIASSRKTKTEWVVINPYTQIPESVEKAFSRYIESRKDLLSTANRIDIYNSFNR